MDSVRERKVSRNVSLDIARCLFMFGVVLQHAFALCKGAPDSPFVPYATYAIFDCLTHPSVDGFTSLSGWFGVHCTIKRLFRLGCLILFCGVLHFLIHEVGRICCGDYFVAHYGIEIPSYKLSWRGFRYWYLGAYLKLLLATIVLNPILSRIAKLSRKWILLVFGVFVGLSYLSLLWFPWESHSPRTVIFIYIVVRFVMMFDVANLIKSSPKVRHVVGWGAIIMLAEIAINGKFRLGLHIGNYASPLTILTGLLIVAWFSAVDLSERNLFARLCKWIAPSMIAVYMLHWNMMTTFFNPVPKMIVDTLPWVHPVVAFVVCAICVFSICTLLDLVRRRCVDAFLPRLNAALRNSSRLKELLALYEKRLS